VTALHTIVTKWNLIFTHHFRSLEMKSSIQIVSNLELRNISNIRRKIDQLYQQLSLFCQFIWVQLQYFKTVLAFNLYLK